jgi:hypothetical protein
VDGRAVSTDSSNNCCLGLHLAADRLFGPLKQNLGGSQLHSNEEVEMAFRERFRMHEADFYGNGICERTLRGEKCVSVFWACVEN